MKLAWSRQDFPRLPCADCQWHPACGTFRRCDFHSWHGATQGTRRIGPRVRLPQAKDVPEAPILAVMRDNPGMWFLHWNCDSPASLPWRIPELAAFPERVLFAKLCAMERRGLIRGYGANSRSRGDWHVVGCGNGT